MKQVVWTQDYTVSSFLANPQKKLGLYSLLNLCQDAAWIHATHLGHGYERAISQQMTWVLTRQKLVMETWPDWGDLVQIRTWVRPSAGAFAYRDFEILLNDQVVGASATSWLMMDLQTRRPVKRDFSELEFECRTDYQLPFDAPKIELRNDLHDLGQLQVRNSDLDLNQHVNNTRYAQWILDSIPIDWHRQFKLHEYEINFLAETHAADLITIQKSPDQAPSEQPLWGQFQGQRASDAKTVFVARLKVSQRSEVNAS